MASAPAEPGAAAPAAEALPPGSTIGLLGGGQLGRMTAMAAARLGYDVHIYCPERDSPAARVAAAATCAAYDDAEALAAFAEAVDVVSFEFENVPFESVRWLAARVPVRPDWSVLRIAQDRRLEKDFLQANGIPTAPYGKLASTEDLAAAVALIGRPCLLKTARLGYDGKGQVPIAADTDLAAAWVTLDVEAAIVETWIDFASEISVILARGADGRTAAYEPGENLHEGGILVRTAVPASIPRAVVPEAADIAGRIAAKLELVGLLAVEFFVGRDERLLVNEIAPRPHNSGHWTLDACATSQFEQFVRAICGLPLGPVERHADAVMQNLIGDEVDRWPELMADPDARLHLYGKAEVRPGRKMGHVTRLSPLR